MAVHAYVAVCQIFHSLISRGHHPGGKPDHGGAEEKDYVEALSRQKSLQPIAGALAVHACNLLCFVCDPIFDWQRRKYTQAL
jgi:hypothetical protein